MTYKRFGVKKHNGNYPMEVLFQNNNVKILRTPFGADFSKILLATRRERLKRKKKPQPILTTN